MTLIQLKDYILRRLGSPVINVEIDTLQLEDCIQEATDLFVESHYDGTDIAYIAQNLVADTEEYTLASNIQAITDILTENDLLITDEPLLLKPFIINDYNSMEGVDLTSIEIFKQRIQNLENYFRTDTLFDYNSTTKKLTLAVAPAANTTVILKAFVSEADSTTIYNNLWFKKYATALAKIQWGSNISKYSGATLPGGVTLNGDQIKSDGKEEKEALELELEEKYSAPPDFFVG